MRYGALWLICCATVAAADTYLVSAGVETYDDARVSSLDYACADASAVAAAFRAAGVPAGHVTLLTSDQADPTRRPTRINLIAALQAVRERAGTADRLIFFFAGHGLEDQVDGQQYLLTVDTRRDLIADTALPLRLVSAALRGLQAAEVLFIIDACRNDPSAGRSAVDAALTAGMARGLRPQLARTSADAPPPVLATLLSCDVGERAWEYPAEGHGAFTWSLLRGLSGKAAGPDGRVLLSQLAAYVTTEVANWSQRSGRRQSPRLLNPDGGDMLVLVRSAEPLVSVSFRQQPLSDVVDVVGREYGAQIVLGRGVDPNAKVTGRLDNQPLSVALRVLLLALDLTVTREGDIYIIGAGQAVPAPALSSWPDGLPPTFPKPAEWPEYVPWPPATDPQLRFRVDPKDRMPQVLVPAGEFRMGSTPGEVARSTTLQTLPQWVAVEGPARNVSVDSFWMDLHEITNEQYCRFLNASRPDLPVRRSWVAATGEVQHPLMRPGLQLRGSEYRPLESLENHPVSLVTGAGAAAYAAWVGRQLPSEIQWERAARAGTRTRYVWGESDVPPAGAGNFYDEETARTLPTGGQPIAGYRDGYALTAPVAQFAANGFGLFDIDGNVWEWCIRPAGQIEQVPPGTPPAGEYVVRGGCWYIGPDGIHLACRRWPETVDYHDGASGFRCVSPATQPVASSYPGGVAPTVAKPADWPEYLPWPPATDPRLRFRVHPMDGMPQVLIPAGEFTMGAEEAESEEAAGIMARLMPQDSKSIAWLFQSERPQRRIKTSAFWMDLHAVTNAQYCQFLNATAPSTKQRREWLLLRDESLARSVWAQWVPARIEWVHDTYRAVAESERWPVNWVTWHGAEAYASWAGRSLPSEAQWDRAARAGQEGLIYAWGSAAQPPPGSGNFLDAAAHRDVASLPRPYFTEYDDGYGTLSPVAGFEANAYGLYDMAGNVMCWCRDHSVFGWYESMAAQDPVCSSESENRVVRGSAWYCALADVRLARRYSVPADGSETGISFRCAQAP